MRMVLTFWAPSVFGILGGPKTIKNWFEEYFITVSDVDQIVMNNLDDAGTYRYYIDLYASKNYEGPEVVIKVVNATRYFKCVHFMYKEFKTI